MKRALIIYILFLVYGSTYSQITGNVDYKFLGVSFVVPDGWVGQEADGSFVMGSNTTPGIIILLPHQHTTLSAIEAEAKSGIMDQSTMLILQGDIDPISTNAIGGLFTGTTEGQSVKSYIIGMINPYGSGISIFVMTSPEAFNDQHIAIAKKVASSVTFKKPEKSPLVDQWKEKFSNARLTYMDSYYSSGPSVNGYSTGGGYDSKIEIDLCSQGYFNYNSNSSVSVDTGGAFGNAASSGNGQGSWSIRQGPDGGGVLVLTYHTGEIKEYTLTYDQDGKTYLNGYRYYVTYGTTTDDGPNCY